MKRVTLIITSYFFISNIIWGQQDTITVDNAVFGIDKKHKIIVSHLTSSWFTTDKEKVTLNFQKELMLTIPIDSIRTDVTTKIVRNAQPYTLYFTPYPLIHIKIDDTIIDEPKKIAKFTYAYQDTIIHSTIGIELRGNISLGFPKKSYDLEFRDDHSTNSSKDVQFLNMRNDDDWILDGMYNEPLRIRSYFSNKLWQQLYQLPYQKEETKAKSGIDVAYTEVFINNTYQGVFALTEQVDRKLLRLKKNSDQEIQGVLFKASSYEGGPTFAKAPDFKNIFPHWAGFRMEYPVVDYKSHWSPLYELVQFVIEASTEDFNREISTLLDLDNAIDYFIFVNVLRATDNLGKNYFIARYSKSSPFYFVPWDLDGVLGTIQDGKKISTTDDILSNKLFERLLQDNPEAYQNRLKSRWFTLRNGTLQTENFLSTMETIYMELKKNKVYHREQMVWPSTPKDEDLIYVKDWIRQRLDFLDTYFNKLDQIGK